MAKKVPPTKFTEWEGLDRINDVVHRMNCIFRETSKDDFGIDGEIEVVLPTINEGKVTRGGIVKVQSKAGMSYIKQDSDSHFFTPVKLGDLETWLSGNVPVIFIVYHSEDDMLYWKDVKAYAKIAPNIFHPPHRIEFDKMKDKFDVSCYDALCSLAETSPPPVSMEKQETLYFNLLKVNRLPPTITHAHTAYQNDYDIRSQLEGYIPPFCIREEQLYTLVDLRDPRCVLKPFCKTETIKDLPVKQWLTKESNVQNYIFLLNQLLTSHLRRYRVYYNNTYKRYYFPRENEASTEFRRDWHNVRTGRQARPRLVAKYYQYGKDAYWRHLAVNMTFLHAGDAWYLQILPKYFYTEDGRTPCDNKKVGAYTTKIKAVERNTHVLNHVLFWADVLSGGGSNIELQLSNKTIMSIEKMPLTGTAHFAIVNDSVASDEDEEVEQLSLFDNDDGEQDGDYYI